MQIVTFVVVTAFSVAKKKQHQGEFQMIKHWMFILNLMILFAFHLPAAKALPLGNMHMTYEINADGTFTYQLRLANYGPPLAPSVATPPDHQI